jgi:hypothetical protein
MVALTEKGKKEFEDHKSLQDVFGPYQKHPVGVIGEKGTSHQSTVVFNADRGIEEIVRSYQASANYKPFDLPADLRANGSFLKTINFFIDLESTPRMRGNRVRGDAAPDDVNVTNAVVTDDQGETIFPLSNKPLTSNSGEINYSGVDVVPQTVTQRSTASATGSGGYASATGFSTVTYNSLIPWSEDHPYYEASYVVVFPLFDDKGEPLIRDNAKKITLHIIRPVGEQQVEYDLKPVTGR